MIKLVICDMQLCRALFWLMALAPATLLGQDSTYSYLHRDEMTINGLPFTTNPEQLAQHMGKPDSIV